MRPPLLPLLLLLILAPAFSVECSVGGTPVACPFTFSVALHTACLPANLSNTAKVDVVYPGEFFADPAGTMLAGGGTLYRDFYKDGATLYFPAPRVTKTDFSTYVSINGIVANTTGAGNISACPCALEAKGFSVRYDDATGGVILQGAVSGSAGCMTDGSVIYRTIFFISKGGVLTEVASGTSMGEHFEIYSNSTYLSDDPLAFEVAVTDAASGTVYGMFPPEFLKPNDFSVSVIGPIRLTEGVQGMIRVNITNKGSITEAYSLALSGAPAGWQSSSSSTRALMPGESGIFSLSAMPAAGASGNFSAIVNVTSAGGRSKPQNVTLQVSRNVVTTAELYALSENASAGQEIPLNIFVRNIGSSPDDRIYWTLFSSPPARMGDVPVGSLPASGIHTFSNSTFFEKTNCPGYPEYRKIVAILVAAAANPSKAEEITSQLTRYSNVTAVASDASSFAASRNKTAASIGSLLSKVISAQDKALSNCSSSEGVVSIAVFGVSTLNGATFESQPVAIRVAGKQGSMSIAAVSENVSVPRSASTTALFRLTSALPVERQVSLRASQTSFKIGFPNGSVVSLPPYGTLEIPVTITDKSTIVKPLAERLEITGSGEDATGEIFSFSATVNVTVRNPALEFSTAPPATIRVEQGANKTILLSFRNGGQESATFNFSGSGGAVVRPASISLGAGESASVNYTIVVPLDATEGTRISQGFVARTAQTGEELTYRTNVTVAASQMAALKKNLDGLAEATETLRETCRYYSLSKLDVMIENSRSKYLKGDYNGAKGYYDSAKKEYAVAEDKCANPNTGATLLIIAALVAVGGAVYYFAVLRKGKKPGYYAPQYGASQPQQQQWYGKRQ